MSNRKDRDWLPIIVLGVAVTILLVALIIALYMFLSDSPDQKSLSKISVKKLVERGKKEKPGPKRPITAPKKQKITKVKEKSPPVHVPGKDAVQKKSDLIAYYPFSGNANDVSGNGNHGTVHGASLAKDRFGNMNSAYSFDGVDDYVDIGRPLVSGDFTISFWLKSNGRQNRFAVPVSQGNMAYKGFNFTFTKGLYNGFCWGTWKEKKVSDPHWGKSAWHTQGFNFPRDINKDLSWHYLAATYKDKTIAVYRDGKLQGSASGFPINYGRFNFNIGRASGNRDFNHRTFNGLIDDIRIYSRALSEKEILGLYKNSGYKRR